MYRRIAGVARARKKGMNGWNEEHVEQAGGTSPSRRTKRSQDNASYMPVFLEPARHARAAPNPPPSGGWSEDAGGEGFHSRRCARAMEWLCRAGLNAWRA